MLLLDFQTDLSSQCGGLLLIIQRRIDGILFAARILEQDSSSNICGSLHVCSPYDTMYHSK